MKKEYVQLNIFHLCLFEFGLIFVVKVVHSNYMIFVEVLNANLKNKLFLLLHHFSFKELDLKIQ